MDRSSINDLEQGEAGTQHSIGSFEHRHVASHFLGERGERGEGEGGALGLGVVNPHNRPCDLNPKP